MKHEDITFTSASLVIKYFVGADISTIEVEEIEHG